ncbi:hypothetical protein ABWH96_11070 [Marivirga tractuosa]|uniref:hypothetical protein n=1 Tax=Marivirga tractuosa TaxID=1006 RepID=UPI0035D023D5
MKKFLFPLTFILVLFSCLPDEPTFDAFRRVEVQRLLSNRESKSWLLEERILFNEEVQLDSCQTPRQLIFNFTSSSDDSDSLFYVNPAEACGNSNDTLKGSWFVPTTITPETPIDTLIFVWEGSDTAIFQIDNLNPENLSISTYFEEDSLMESFTHSSFPEDDEQ